MTLEEANKLIETMKTNSDIEKVMEAWFAINKDKKMAMLFMQTLAPVFINIQEGKDPRFSKNALDKWLVTMPASKVEVIQSAKGN